ncbi:hypothetical protein [Paenibacillus lautus]|uniref:hypothetical protein n=1 Tax=Paenibacillus lautus TaxID=1401 RepID=UPI003D2BC985
MSVRFKNWDRIKKIRELVSVNRSGVAARSSRVGLAVLATRRCMRCIAAILATLQCGDVSYAATVDVVVLPTRDAADAAGLATRRCYKKGGIP